MALRYTVRQVVSGAIALLALVATAGLAALMATADSLGDAMRDEVAHIAADERIASRIVAHTERQMDLAAEYASDPRPELLAAFRAEGMAVYEQVRQYLFLDLSREERMLVERIRERHERIEVAVQRSLAEPDGQVENIPDVRALRADLNRLLQLRRGHMLHLLQEQERVWGRLHLMIGMMAGTFLLVTVAVTIFLRRRLVAPLSSIAEAAQRIGAGDFDARVPWAGRDELGAVAASFNRMAERLEQARAEAEHAERRYQSLFERIPVGLYRTTPDGRFVDGNPALVQLLGFASRQELLEADAAGLYTDTVARLQWQRDLDAATGVLEVDRHNLRADGTLLWLRDTARAVRSADGSVLYYEGALQDVTERMRAEEALRRSEARFRSLVENASEGVLILSSTGRIQYQSPAVQRILGYSDAELAGTPALALVHPEDAERVGREFEELAAQPRHARAIELRCRHRDGSWRMLRGIGSNLLDDADVGGVVINMMDTTAHLQLEAQLAHAQKMEAVGRLAGGIAHDFNNLLTAIEGYADLLRDRLRDSDAAQADLHEIRRAVERGARLTRQLLAFGRRQVVRRRATDVGVVIRDLEQMLRRVITEDVALHTSAEPGCWVEIDPGQLEQVVMNLVVNARDAEPRSGISVAVSAPQEAVADGTAGAAGAHVLLTVSDDGCGIEAADLPFIFEPFFTTKEVGKGTGLGLATVYSIVEQSGGRVDVQSRPGAGTTVRVMLPRVTAAVPPARAAEPRTPGHGNGELVLLVEDEPAVRALAERVLQRNGYRVISAVHGSHALELAATLPAPIDLLVTDVVMPVMGGVQLAAALTRQQPALRVLFMSGYAPDDLPRRSDGAPLYFLEKPFIPARLAELVRQVLDDPHAAACDLPA